MPRALPARRNENGAFSRSCAPGSPASRSYRPISTPDPRGRPPSAPRRTCSIATAATCRESSPNESSTIGMLLALQDIGLAGKVRFVGFDAAATLIDAVRARQLDGVVVQNPMRMGYLGVKTMAEQLRGKPVERLIDTGVMLVTAANLDS